MMQNYLFLSLHGILRPSSGSCHFKTVLTTNRQLPPSNWAWRILSIAYKGIENQLRNQEDMLYYLGKKFLLTYLLQKRLSNKQMPMPTCGRHCQLVDAPANWRTPLPNCQTHELPVSSPVESSQSLSLDCSII